MVLTSTVGVILLLNFCSKLWAFPIGATPIGFPVVQTNDGPIKGFTEDVGDGNIADIFLNIPFAQPPLGNLRFEKTQPNIPWTDVKITQDWGQGCVPGALDTQYFANNDTFAPPDITQNSEDCLSLNVFKPNDTDIPAPTGGYPVLFWIYGGGFCFGNAAAFGYKNLSYSFVSKGIIVVSIQYRLGPFGFASTGDQTMPGNLGFWDATMALKWVHENIHHFGGNPNKITAWGYSAGSVLASHLVLSPHSRDYIAQTIEQSGPLFGILYSFDQVIDSTKELAKDFLNCPIDSSANIKLCLKNISLEKYFDVLDIDQANLVRKGINFVKYQPRIDYDFIPKNFTELFKEAPPKPSMMGNVEMEMIVHTMLLLSRITQHLFLVTPDKYASYGKENLTNFIRDVVVPPSWYGPQAENIANEIINFYVCDGRPKNADYVWYLTQYTKLMSHIYVIMPAYWHLEQKLKHNWPVYYYVNEHYNPAVIPSTSAVKGAYHTIEYPYLFGVFPLGQFDMDAPDEKIIQNLLVDSMGNFVKTGNPSTSNVPWPQTKKAHPLQYLSITPTPKFKHAYLQNVYNFWNHLSKKYAPINIVTGAGATI